MACYCQPLCSRPQSLLLHPQERLKTEDGVWGTWSPTAELQASLPPASPECCHLPPDKDLAAGDPDCLRGTHEPELRWHMLPTSVIPDGQGTSQQLFKTGSGA